MSHNKYSKYPQFDSTHVCSTNQLFLLVPQMKIRSLATMQAVGLVMHLQTYVYMEFFLLISERRSDPKICKRIFETLNEYIGDLEL